jgi:5-methylcytosine-specific restriction endonuclease McrA
MKKLDLAGKKFGRLTVIEDVGKNRHGKYLWKCVCDCPDETEIIVQSSHLVHGHTQSCGCLQREVTSKARGSNLLGRTFGRLSVIGFGGIDVKGCYTWLCQCSCGNTKDVVLPSSRLLSEHTRSCGCLQREATSRANRTHGLSKTNEYKTVMNSHRREASSKYDSGWTAEMEFELRKVFPSCVVDGSTDRLSTGHVYPLSLGFGLVPGNAVRLCVHCNSRQNDRLPGNLPKSMPKDAGALIIEAARMFKNYWDSLHPFYSSEGLDGDGI